MNRLKGKTAFISGATSGIGEACAILLATMGVNIILAGRRKQKLTDLKNEYVYQRMTPLPSLSIYQGFRGKNSDSTKIIIHTHPPRPGKRLSLPMS